MGYRLRLGEVKKNKTSDKFRDMSLEDTVSYYAKSSDAPYRPAFHTELYEIGKDVSFDSSEPFYTKFCITHEYESDFSILDKKALGPVIEYYRGSTQEYYKKLFDKPHEDMKLFAESKVREWDRRFPPYYLDDENTDGFLVRSWSMEYAIFNILYIYRTFDFDKKYLIYSGW